MAAVMSGVRSVPFGKSSARMIFILSPEYDAIRFPILRAALLSFGILWLIKIVIIWAIAPSWRLPCREDMGS